VIKDRSVQLRKRHLASLMIKYGMRASIIAVIFDMPLTQARALYEEIMGRPSPSGQKPRSDEYYFAPVMRIHASAFMMFYRYISLAGVDPRAALVSAYAQYSDLCQGQPLMPIDRAWRLIVLANQKDGTIREARCRNRDCRTYTIIQPYEGATRYECPSCQGSLEVSQRLRGKSGRKRKPRTPDTTH
jgi:hypothetical protein